MTSLFEVSVYVASAFSWVVTCSPSCVINFDVLNDLKLELELASVF